MSLGNLLEIIPADLLDTVIAACPMLMINIRNQVECSGIFTQRRSVVKSDQCFQQRLFVSVFVCQHDNFRTSKHRMTKLEVGALCKNLDRVRL